MTATWALIAILAAVAWRLYAPAVRGVWRRRRWGR